MRIKRIKQKCAFDLETLGLHPWKLPRDCPFAVSIYFENGSTWYREWEVEPSTREVYAEAEDLEYIADILQDSQRTVIMHNGKFDIRMMELNFGIKFSAKLEETMFMARVCKNDEFTYALKPLSQKYLGYPVEDQDELGKAAQACRRKARSLNLKAEKAGLPPPYKLAAPSKYNKKKDDAYKADYWLPRHFDPSNRLCEKYAVGDVERTFLLYALYSELMDDLSVRQTYDNEMDLWQVVYEMETRGAAINVEVAQREFDYNRQKADKHRAELIQLAGKEFNPGSPIQLRKIIYDDFKLPVTRKTPTGEPSTDWKALREHLQHPFVRAMFDHKSADMACNNFFSKFLELAVPDVFSEYQCIHPNFNQADTRTGRFSMSDPNLQQATSRENNAGAEKVRAKLPFIPRPGYSWLLMDYSQVEVRIFADMSQEPTMLEAIAQGKKIHNETANRAWGGRNNPAAIDAAIIALELFSDVPSALVRGVWDELGCGDTWLSHTDRNQQAREIAVDWLEMWDYDIIKAELSIGKETSKTRGKQINFGKIYGGGPSAVMDLLFCTYGEARKFLSDYDRVFPTLVSYCNEVTNQARRDGYCYNAYGRKYNIDPNFAYKAVNYKVQGSAADQIKEAMRRCWRYLKKCDWEGYLVMQIHDELVFEIRNPVPMQLAKDLKNIMEDHGGRFGVPTPVEIKIAHNTWDEEEDFILAR